MSDETEPQISRRSLLDLLLSGSLISFALSVVYPVWRYIAPPRITESVAGNTVAAKVGELTPNSGKIFRFGSRPGILVRHGGRRVARVHRRVHPSAVHRPVPRRPGADLVRLPQRPLRPDRRRTSRGRRPRPLDQLRGHVKEEEVIVSVRA